MDDMPLELEVLSIIALYLWFPIQSLVTIKWDPSCYRQELVDILLFSLGQSLLSRSLL